MRHTNGPWNYAKNKVNHGVYTANGDKVAMVIGTNIQHIDKRCEADARLIAAAPDLLAALQGMLCGDYHDCPAVRERRAAAYAAIAKATGDSK